MIKDPFQNFTKEEITILKKLNTPYKIQQFVDSLVYHEGRRLAPINVLRQRKADCVEAAVFSSVVLMFHKIENFFIDLGTIRDEEHVLCVYKQNNKYGSIAQSKFINLKGRNPVYNSVRELVMSYFEHYFNFYGELSLRRYSIPIRLSRKNFDWIYKNRKMYEFEKSLDNFKHYTIFSYNERLPTVSKDKFEREILIFPKNVRIGKKYRKDQ